MSAFEAAYLEGRFSDAEVGCKQFLTVHPDDLEAKFLLARVLAKTGRIEQSLALITEILSHYPDFVEALKWQGALLRELGRFSEAVPVYDLLAKLRPEDPAILRSLGLCLLSAERLDEAEEVFRKELQVDPVSAAALHNLGYILVQKGAFEEAIPILQSALKAAPNASRTLLCLGQALRFCERYEEAYDIFARAAELEPTNAEIHLYWAKALSARERTLEAEGHLRRAIALDPGLVGAYNLLGLQLKDLGNFKEARECFEKAISLQPNQGIAYRGLSRCMKFSQENSELVEAMEEVASTGLLSPDEGSSLHFALGKAYTDLSEYGMAMGHFDRANAILFDMRPPQERIDRSATAAGNDRIISTFTSTYFKRYRSLGCPSELPVFLTGIIRSGTTLLEQILSSHPNIGAGDELVFWGERWAGRVAENQASPDQSEIAKLADEYLGLLDWVAPGKKRVTDKNPFNFLRLGPIHLTFPQARIIHIRREPVDNCLSIYVTPLGTHSFSHNREDIVFYYKEYLRLMEHWRQTLPAERFLEVDYEEIVADREPVLRQIIDFCGLEWDDACLHHDKNPRQVITPSNWQVRQPIYSTSMQLWRKYKPWLGAFKELVGIHHPGRRWTDSAEDEA